MNMIINLQYLFVYQKYSTVMYSTVAQVLVDVKPCRSEQLIFQITVIDHLDHEAIVFKQHSQVVDKYIVLNTDLLHSYTVLVASN